MVMEMGAEAILAGFISFHIAVTLEKHGIAVMMPVCVCCRLSGRPFFSIVPVLIGVCDDDCAESVHFANLVGALFVAAVVFYCCEGRNHSARQWKREP